MTPIFVRPVREQLEHDRLIPFLTARYKRKYDVIANVGEQQLGAVKLAANTYFPDVILIEGKKLAGLVEVETVESTNNLEAMAQWTYFSRARVPFHLYVPVLAYDAARRLCDANQVSVSELWTYRAVNDQFDLVRMFADANAVKTGGKTGAPKAILFIPEPPKVEPPPPPPPPPAPKVEVTVKKPIGKPGSATKFITVMSPVKPTLPPPAKPALAVKPVPVAKVAPPAPPAKKAAKSPAPGKAAAKASVKSSAKSAKSVKPVAKKKPVAKAKPTAKPNRKPVAKTAAKNKKKRK